MTQVLVVGMAVVDFLFEVDSMPDAAEKYIAQAAHIVGGGGAANAACAIAKLGGQARLAARVGDDFIGNMIIDDLQHSSVDCSLLVKSTGARSSYSSVLLDANGERQIVNFRGCDLSDDVSGIKNSVPSAVLTDTRWLRGATAALQLAKDIGVPGVVDAEPPLPSPILELASHIAFSRQGLESIAGTLNSVDQIKQALAKVADQYDAWISMTDGECGVFTLSKGEYCHHPAIPVAVVDTLGAGDVWHGAFAHWLACGHNEVEAVKFACAAAALKCARSGGGRSCPDFDEVVKML